jgi:hypothetical protein
MAKGETLVSAKWYKSTIIRQTQSVSVPPKTDIFVTIQPPAGQTWLINLLAWLIQAGSALWNIIGFEHGHVGNAVRNGIYPNYTYPEYKHPYLTLDAIITYDYYGEIYYCTATGLNTPGTTTGYYGYSGFVLGTPKYIPKSDPIPRERELTQPLPDKLTPLKKYATELFSEDEGDYKPAIVLERDTPLAHDPVTGFPIERYTAIITAENLLSIINQRDNPLQRPTAITERGKYKGKKPADLTKIEFLDYNGLLKYFMKWSDEGITI